MCFRRATQTFWLVRSISRSQGCSQGLPPFSGVWTSCGETRIIVPVTCTVSPLTQSEERF